MGLVVCLLAVLGTTQASYSIEYTNTSIPGAVHSSNHSLSIISKATQPANPHNTSHNNETDCNPANKTVTVSTTSDNSPTTVFSETENNDSITHNNANSSISEHLSTSTLDSTTTSVATINISSVNKGNQDDGRTENMSMSGTASTIMAGTTEPNISAPSDNNDASSDIFDHPSTSTLESTSTSKATHNVNTSDIGNEQGSGVQNISTDGRESATEPETTAASTRRWSWHYKLLVTRNRTMPTKTPPPAITASTPDIYDDDFGGEYYDISKVTFPLRNTTTLHPPLPRAPKTDV